MNNCSGEVIMIEVEKKGIGKATVGLIVTTVLVGILVISNVWSYTTLQNRINTLSNEKDNLESQVNTLQSQMNSLNTTYQYYVSNHSHSDSEYDALQSQTQTLANEKNQLQNENLILKNQIAEMNETLTLFEKQTSEVFYFRIFSLYNYNTEEYWYAWYKIKSADYYNYRFDVETHAPALLYDRVTEELISRTAGSWTDPESDVIQEIAYDLWQVCDGDEEVFVNLAVQFVHQLCYNVTLYTKYPIETMVEESGDCDNLAVLTASILNAGGLDVVLLLVEADGGGHCMLGVSMYSPPDDRDDYRTDSPWFVDVDGEEYWLIEATWGDPGGAGWMDPATPDAYNYVGAFVGDNPWEDIDIVSVIQPAW
jgi:chaperonin cofactor prefoldin